MPRTLWHVSPRLVVHAADPVVGIGLHELAMLTPVLPEEDVHQDAVHRAVALLLLEQLCHPPGDELNRLDGTAPEVTANIIENGTKFVPK
jgi:hypothetical protein